MIDFSTLQGLSIPEGVVTQIEDASGRVIWMLNVGGPIVLEVEKITSDTYAAETTYTDEKFILLDIYPKTNGVVTVTYGGLAKTITDTSGVEEPNAQQVFFGTFNGTSDSVETPERGTLVIEGDCDAFGIGAFQASKLVGSRRCLCITEVISFGEVSYIPDYAFGSMDLLPEGCISLKNIRIPDTVTRIGGFAFAGCYGLESIFIPSSVIEIGVNPFISSHIVDENFIYFSVENISLGKGSNFRKEGNCFIETHTGRLICGTGEISIPADIKIIGERSFMYQDDIPIEIEIPESVSHIESYAFGSIYGRNFIMKATTPPTIGTSVLQVATDLPITIIVPKGCGEIYKAAEGWSEYADYIVEAS